MQRLGELQPVEPGPCVGRRRQEARAGGGERQQPLDGERQRHCRLGQAHAVEAGTAAAQEAFERAQQPLRREHQLRGVDDVGRQFDLGEKALRRLERRLRVGQVAQRPVDLGEQVAAEAAVDAFARQLQQVVQRAQAERLQRVDGFGRPAEHGQRQRCERGGQLLGGDRRRSGEAARARQRQPPRRLRRGCLAERRPVAEAGELHGDPAVQPRAAAEQAFAAAGLEKQSVVAHADRGAELVGPAGEFEQGVAFALRLAFDGDQVRGQRLRGGELLPRGHTGAAGGVAAEGDLQPLRGAIDDHQRRVGVDRARGQLQRQCGQGDGQPQRHGASAAARRGIDAGAQPARGRRCASGAIAPGG